MVHRLLRRIARAALYFALGVVLFSIGLRVYSSWHVPHALRVFNQLLQVGADQPFENVAAGLFRQYKFQPVNLDSCVNSGCYESLTLTLPVPGLNRSAGRLDRVAKWALENVAIPLGLRPWVLQADVSVDHGRIRNAGYVLTVIDSRREAIGSGAWISAETQLILNDEDSPDLRVSTGGRGSPKWLWIRYSPQASELSSTLKPRLLSCIWRIGFCETGLDVFPELRKWAQIHEDHRRLRLAGDDPCPYQNMPARVRDVNTWWVATVIAVLNSQELTVESGRVLRGDPNRVPYGQFVPLSDLPKRLFPNGVQPGQRLIMNESYECAVFPWRAEDERLIQTFAGIPR